MRNKRWSLLERRYADNYNAEYGWGDYENMSFRTLETCLAQSRVEAMKKFKEIVKKKYGPDTKLSFSGRFAPNVVVESRKL